MRYRSVPPDDESQPASWAARLLARVGVVRPQIDRLIAATLTEQRPDVGRLLSAAGVPFTLTGLYVALTALQEAGIEPELQATLTDIVLRAAIVAARLVP